MKDFTPKHRSEFIAFTTSMSSRELKGALVYLSWLYDTRKSQEAIQKDTQENKNE